MEEKIAHNFGKKHGKQMDILEYHVNILHKVHYS